MKHKQDGLTLGVTYKVSVEIQMGRVQIDDKYRVTILPIYLCLYHIT